MGDDDHAGAGHAPGEGHPPVPVGAHRLTAHGGQVDAAVPWQPRLRRGRRVERCRTAAGWETGATQPAAQGTGVGGPTRAATQARAEKATVGMRRPSPAGRGHAGPASVPVDETGSVGPCGQPHRPRADSAGRRFVGWPPDPYTDPVRVLPGRQNSHAHPGADPLRAVARSRSAGSTGAGRQAGPRRPPRPDEPSRAPVRTRDASAADAHEGVQRPWPSSP